MTVNDVTEGVVAGCGDAAGALGLAVAPGRVEGAVGAFTVADCPARWSTLGAERVACVVVVATAEVFEPTTVDLVGAIGVGVDSEVDAGAVIIGAIDVVMVVGAGATMRVESAVDS